MTTPAETRLGDHPSDEDGGDEIAGDGPPDARRSGATSAASAPPDAAGAVDGLTASDRRRLRRAWAAATLPVLVAYTWVLTVGRWDLLQRQFFDDFFDAQGRSLLQGRLDVPSEVVAFEGFLVDGRTYIYFGPVPALLRMPILAVTDRFDGRLTTLSMLVATAVLSVAAFRLACVLRALVRGEAPVGRREPLATAGLAVAALAAPPFFLASAAIVYHEAAIWGLALAVAGLDAVARWALRPITARLVGASALITAALLARQSVGLAPLAALGLAGAVTVFWAARGARAIPAGGRTPGSVARTVAALAVAGLVPLAVTVGLNVAKFGTVLTPPSDRHVQSLRFDDRQEMLADNDGSLFGPQFAPTTLTQYLRPDGIDVRRDFPYLDFPRQGPTLVGDVRFDALDWSSCLPASAPALTALAAVAAGWAVRNRTRAGPPWLATLCVGALVGGIGVIGLGYIANRYLNDLYPTVLVPAVVGFHVAVRVVGGWHRRRRVVAASAAVALVALGGLVNTTLALSYQRERGPVVPEPWRAEWVGWRVAMPGAYDPYVVDAGQRLPTDVFDGRVAVVGDCAGFYVRYQDRWEGVERGPGVGVYDVRIDLGDLPDDGRRVPLVTLGADGATTVVAIRRVDAARVQVDVRPPPEAGDAPDWQAGEPTELSGTVTLRVDADRRAPPSLVTHDRTVLNGTPLVDDDGPDRLGKAPPIPGVDPRFPGSVRLDPVEPSACRTAQNLVD